ncbi:MAG: hypothetical protein IKO72_09635 [Kiritimatiellae bacterium]|nr:hypothetical protein [Kiritimatiellia bacterium]
MKMFKCKLLASAAICVLAAAVLPCAGAPAPGNGAKALYVTVDPMDETTIYKTGMTKENLRALVVKYRKAGVRGLVWRVQHLGIAGYPTRELSTIDDYPPKLPDCLWERCKDRKITAHKIPTFRKMLENMDPLAEAVKACREEGLEIYFFVDLFDEMFGKFLLANTDVLVTAKDGAKYPGLRDYSNEKAVRQKLDAIAELYRYAPDGLYLCTSCHARHLAFPEPDMAFGTLPGAKFTEFLARLKAECRPHGIKLMVGTALGGSLDFSSPHFSEHVKYRIELEWKRWIDEGLADSLVLGDYECLWKMNGLWRAKGVKSVAPGSFPADVFIPEYVSYAKGRVPLLVFSGWITARQCHDQLRQCADTVRDLGLDGIFVHESMALEGTRDSDAMLGEARCRMAGARDVWAQYVPGFNSLDEELYVNAVPNSAAEEFLRANAPSFSCPDHDVERAYCFRWWTYRKHVKKAKDGSWIVSEFLPPVPWAGPEGTINCASGHHLREGRWLGGGEVAYGYLSWMLEKGGVSGPVAYCWWPATSLCGWLDVTGDEAAALRLLPLLERNFEAWAKGWTHKGFRFGRGDDGLYSITDDREGTEMSLSGNGRRPLVNSAMYGEAKSLARLWSLAGDTARSARWSAEAAKIESAVKTRLWNVERGFFTTLRPDGALSPIRELHGYAPWYFGMPLNGLESAWKRLSAKDGFKARFGMPFPETSSPGFALRRDGHECQWNGPSWPYATSIALTALERHLHGGGKHGVGRDVFAGLLVQYAKQHAMRTFQSRSLPWIESVPWIDENLDPDTGEWLARSIILATPKMRARFPKERGRDYNHSTFCDLVITGMAGFVPGGKDDFMVNPLCPASWTHFELERLRYRGRRIDILWNKAYGGLRVLVDGRLAASRKDLGPLKVSLQVSSEVVRR